MRKHTLGPWEVNQQKRPKGAPIEILKSNAPTVSALAYVPHHGHFSEGNALIIAAAPELLAALITLRAEVAEVTARCGWAGNGARALADAAIAKATTDIFN